MTSTASLWMRENCEYTSCVGCTDAAASNYNPGATEEDGSCTYCDLYPCLSPMVTGESCFESLAMALALGGGGFSIDRFGLV